MTKRFLILDVETTIKNKGNPFTKSNRLAYVGAKFAGDSKTYIFDFLAQRPPIDELQRLVDHADYLVAFNAKFDLHWLDRAGISFRGRVWDCQYAEFLFNFQRTKYPSLEEAATKYQLGHKLDVIKEEYWNKGIDTIDIPPSLMIEYLEMDISLTERLFQVQQHLFSTTQSSKRRLFQLHMEDLLVLKEMEKNGILYDTESSNKLAESTIANIQALENQLMVGYEGIPINFSSSDHVSAYLYGGSILVDTRVPIGVYKTGAKVGQTRYKIVTHEYTLPRLIEPLPGSELQKANLYSTDEKVLRQLRGTKEAKRRISLLNERSKQEKLRGTYYGGFPKKLLEMEWSDNYLHPSLNQCVAVTGRLSSTNPNGQNQPPESKQLCISRFSG